MEKNEGASLTRLTPGNGLKKDGLERLLTLADPRLQHLTYLQMMGLPEGKTLTVVLSIEVFKT